MRRFVVAIIFAITCSLVSSCASSDRKMDAPELISAERLADELRLQSGSLIAECMASAGFPEVKQAQALRRDDQPRPRSGVVYWHPLESGPTTPDEARRYGLLGLVSSFQEPPPGDLISGLPAFDDALQECGSSVTVDGMVVPERLNAWAEQANAIRDVFMNDAFDDLQPLLQEQMQCFADATGFDLSQDLPQYEEVLAELGIDEGTWTTYDAPEPVPGQVMVVERAPTRYMPSEAEVALALLFVECAEDTQFFARLELGQRPARDRTLESFAGQIEEFEVWATSAVEVLSG